MREEKKNLEEQEIREARINIIPLLQAEEDRRFLRFRKMELEDEEKLSQEFPDIVVGETPFITTWLPPTQDKAGKW